MFNQRDRHIATSVSQALWLRQAAQDSPSGYWRDCSHHVCEILRADGRSIVYDAGGQQTDRKYGPNFELSCIEQGASKVK